MMRADQFDILSYALGVAVLVLAGVGIYEGVSETRLERECLALGYRDASWRWVGPSYCIAREDQSDIVVPLDSARRAPR